MAGPRTAEPGPYTFLRLVPLNYEAKKAFSLVAEYIVSEDPRTSELRHAAQYIFFEDNDSESAMEVDPDTDAEDPLPFQGFYYLSFDVPPAHPFIGWNLGAGEWKDGWSVERGDVPDLQLSLPWESDFSTYEIAARHASIFFDDEGELRLGTRRVGTRSRVVVGTEELSSDGLVLREGKYQVFFGKLAYTLEYEYSGSIGHEEFVDKLRRFYRKCIRMYIPASLLPGPRQQYSTARFGDWVLRHLEEDVSTGSFTRIGTATNSTTGETGDATVYTRDAGVRARNIAREIRNLKALPAHPQLLRLIHVEYELGEVPTYHDFGNWSDIVTIISSPRLRSPTGVMRSMKHYHRKVAYDPTLCLRTFQGLLQAVAALHAHGIIHRGITLKDWSVVDYSSTETDGKAGPLKSITTVISNYQFMEVAESCIGAVGPKEYRAPEMDACVLPYGQAVDIWALGLVGAQLFFTQANFPWKNAPDRETLERWLGTMKSSLEAIGSAAEEALEFHDLLESMVQWEPEDRISAKDALNHRLFKRLG